MKIITTPIQIAELKDIAKNGFGDFVKAVIDVEQEIMAIDAELHADQESFLLENGSKQKNLWGINLYVDQFYKDGFIEFDSMINLRPSHGNRTRSVDDAEIREKIRAIVNKLVT